MLVEWASDQGTTKKGGNKGPKPLTFPGKRKGKEGHEGEGGSRDPNPETTARERREGLREAGRPVTAEDRQVGHRPTTAAPRQREMERKSERSSEAEG